MSMYRKDKIMSEHPDNRCEEGVDKTIENGVAEQKQD